MQKQFDLEEMSHMMFVEPRAKCLAREVNQGTFGTQQW